MTVATNVPVIDIVNERTPVPMPVTLMPAVNTLTADATAVLFWPPAVSS